MRAWTKLPLDAERPNEEYRLEQVQEIGGPQSPRGIAILKGKKELLRVSRKDFSEEALKNMIAELDLDVDRRIGPEDSGLRQGGRCRIPKGEYILDLTHTVEGNAPYPLRIDLSHRGKGSLKGSVIARWEWDNDSFIIELGIKDLICDEYQRSMRKEYGPSIG